MLKPELGGNVISEIGISELECINQSWRKCNIRDRYRVRMLKPELGGNVISEIGISELGGINQS